MKIKPNSDGNWNYHLLPINFANSDITLPIEPVAELEAVDHNLIPDSGPQISAHQWLDAESPKLLLILSTRDSFRSA